MNEKTWLNRRVRLSPLGHAAKLIVKGETKGEVVGIKSNAVIILLILRDGMKHPQEFAPQFWMLDE